MYANRYDGVLNDYAVKLIKTTARQLTRQHGFSTSDRDDIEQELAIRLLEKLPKHDPSRASLETFITLVINHLAKALLRAQMRKREFSKAISLDEPIPTDPEGDITLLDVTDHENFLVQTGMIPRSGEQQIVLEIDTATMIDSLPETLRDTCLLLTQETVSEVAAKLGVHRDTIYKRLAQIRKHFNDKGLTDPREA